MVSDRLTDPQQQHRHEAIVVQLVLLCAQGRMLVPSRATCFVRFVACSRGAQLVAVGTANMQDSVDSTQLCSDGKAASSLTSP